MLLSALAIVVGLALLVWGSDRFVFGASATARNLGVSPLIVGLTVVGVGTSAPEILISGIAAWNGNPGLSIGNALGSNIANIGLVTGIAALVKPLSVSSETLKGEFTMMCGVIVLAWILLWDLELGKTDGTILLAAFALVLALTLGIAVKARRSDPLRAEFDEAIPEALPTRLALGWLSGGLIVLLASSRMMVWGAVNIAVAFGVSDLLVGLTIVAIGTSLPELAASITSVLKAEPDIAIGTVIGSNMFNLLAVLALPGIIAPGDIAIEAMHRDFPFMVVLSVALLATAYGFRGPGRIYRWEGGTLLVAFCGYQTFLYFSAV